MKRHYLRTVTGFSNRVTKYEQRFCNFEFGNLIFSPADVAIISTLLLRGDQTPGELRSRTSRMFEFNDMAQLEAALEQLEQREEGPFVVRLAREPGKRQSRYQHLLSGSLELAESASDTVLPVVSELEARVIVLKQDVAELKQQLDVTSPLRRVGERQATDGYC